MDIKEIARRMYDPNRSLQVFLRDCAVRRYYDDGPLKEFPSYDLTNDEVLYLVKWWKKQQTEQKEYYLVVNPDALKIYGSEFPEYVNQIEDTSDHFTFHYGMPTRYSEAELETIKQALPTIAPAIDAMKVPAEEDDNGC